MQHPDAESDVSASMDLLSSPHDSERLFAAEYLATLGEKAAIAAPALVRALGDTNPAVQFYAAEALSNMELERVRIVPAADASLHAAAASLSEGMIRRLIYEMHRMNEWVLELCCELVA